MRWDGLMGIVADAAGIQFRLLNRRKGPGGEGVPGRKRIAHSIAVPCRLPWRGLKNLVIAEASVEDLELTSGSNGHEIGAVILASGQRVKSWCRGTDDGKRSCAVLIHMGKEKVQAGRVGEAPALGLADTLERLEFP